MRSRTSRGAPEWSGGKDLYMGSHILGSGKSSGFFGIVPGRFQKVPEGSRWGPPCPGGPTWAVGVGHLALHGLGAPVPQGPCVA